MLHELTAVQMGRLLPAFESWLDKAVEHAESKGFDPETLLDFRLAPDQFNLRRQFQAACDAIKFAVARPAGVEAPKDDDQEKTIAEIRERIQRTAKFVESVDPRAIDEGEEREVRLGWMPGRGIRAVDYVVDFAQLNFYFHASMAYAILRSAGVSLGKRDFITHMRTHAVEEA